MLSLASSGMRSLELNAGAGPAACSSPGSVLIVILCKENAWSDLTALSDMLFMEIVFNPECNSTLSELI